MRWALFSIFICLNCSNSATYLMQTGVLINDKTGNLDIEKIECINDVLIKHVPNSEKYLKNFHVVITSTIENGNYLCGGSHLATVGLSYNQCIARTSYIHEFMHHMLNESMFTCDKEHKIKGIWKLFGLIDQINIEAEKICCPD